MDIETLRTFKDVLIYASITEAAKHDFLAQQTASKRIASLEKELGCELINRTTPVTPTPAGRAVMRYADIILNTYDQMVGHVGEIISKQPGVVRLRRYATNTFGGIAARLTEAVVHQRQNVSLEWLTCDLDDVEMLRSDGIDIGFRHLIVTDGDEHSCGIEGLSEMRLHSIEFPLSFAVKSTHPLAGVQHPTLVDVLQYRIETPSFASRGAVTGALGEYLSRKGLTGSVTTTYCTTRFGYYAAVGDESVALCSGNAASGLSPEGMGLGYVVIRPCDAEYRVLSFALWRPENDNPYLDYVLEELRKADERGLSGLR